MANVIMHLIKDDGSPFDGVSLQTLNERLDALTDQERIHYRNGNAAAIAQHPSVKILIVSGPGTGKSTLFKQRIGYWLQNDSTATILALSFVRKLVADLNNDIQGDENLSEAQKSQTVVQTLHKYARSVVEKNHGTSEFRFEPHLRIIGESWKHIIWDDVLLYSGESDAEGYSWRNFEKQLHDSNFDSSARWRSVRSGYFSLSQFYNAAGFADLIVHAKTTLFENPSLKEHDYFIVDEYQDFNIAEEGLIDELTNRSKGVLVVGDDDQVLYEKLKSGKAALIRDLYTNPIFTNAMLPFCSRSSFHIVKTAGHFLKFDADANCIEKIYLPLSTNGECPKVQVVGCATPSTAVDYIEKFIEDRQPEIQLRKRELNEGSNKDPFLLVLTPAKQLRFYATGGAGGRLLEAIAQFRDVEKKYSEDYYKILTYYSVANYPSNNFTFRKALHYENWLPTEAVGLIKKCIRDGQRMCESVDPRVAMVLAKARSVKEVIDSTDPVRDKLERLSRFLEFSNIGQLVLEFERRQIDEGQSREIEHQEEEDAELEELAIKQMAAVELMSIVGSKGLSADHVMIIGFDDLNMARTTRNAFYVAMTRARKTLHLIAALKSGGSQRPHDYLDWLPIENIEFSKYKKSNRQKVTFLNRTYFDRYLQSLRRTIRA